MFVNSFYVIKVILILFYREAPGSTISTRIVGGYKAPLIYGQFVTSLQNLHGSHVCGGAVISAEHILTAGHCVYGVRPEYIKAVVGTTNLDTRGSEHSVISIKLYQNFNLSLRSDDIAILKVNKPFDLNNVKILKLYEKPLIEGELVIVTGYGAPKKNGESSRDLLALNQFVFSQDTCRYAMRNFREIFENMFCTFTQIGQGTCNGDSGSPLINREYEIVGVVSWGIPCAVGFPDVHTRINPYISWIKEEIKS